MKKLVIAAVAALAVVSASNVFAMNDSARANVAAEFSDTTDTVAPKPAEIPAKPAEEPAKFTTLSSDTTDTVAQKPATKPCCEPVKK